MNTQALIDIGRALVVSGKVLLAIDNNNLICNKPFVRLAIPKTEEVRCVYRELIVIFSCHSETSCSNTVGLERQGERGQTGANATSQMQSGSTLRQCSAAMEVTGT